MIISLISCWCWYNVIRSNCFRLIFLFHQFCNSCEALQLYGYEKLAISCLFYFSILPDTGLWSLCNISGWINSSFCVNLTLGCVSCPKHCCIFTLPYGTNFDNCNWHVSSFVCVYGECCQYDQFHLPCASSWPSSWMVLIFFPWIFNTFMSIILKIYFIGRKE